MKTMSNSPLICYTRISPNSSPRYEQITKITPHYMAGNCSIETCGEIFAPTSRQASSNYGIGSDGRIAMYCPENRRSWCSSSSWNDQKAVTIEVANVTADGYITEAAWNALVDLCVDICQRNGIPSLVWTGDKYGSLTCHYMFSDTSCPGQYLKGRMGLLADVVNAKLHPVEEPEPIIWRPGMQPDFGVNGSDVFRLYNPFTGDHIWTTSTNERDGLKKMGWDSEGTAWQNLYPMPVYRIFNPFTGEHLFTTSLNECNTLRDNGWQYEGVVDLGAREPNDCPVYRLYDGTFHMFTTSDNERNALIANGWTDEGIAWYQLAA